MSFDLHPSISDGSPEGQGLRIIMDRDRVTPEEAVRNILREIQPKESSRPRPSHRSPFGAVVERLRHSRGGG
ncbi:hypothetical protein BH11ARM2_BH11ARM2_36740 [soil metagenome]